jgi:hypothetical protein
MKLGQAIRYQLFFFLSVLLSFLPRQETYGFSINAGKPVLSGIRLTPPEQKVVDAAGSDSIFGATLVLRSGSIIRLPIGDPNAQFELR